MVKKSEATPEILEVVDTKANALVRLADQPPVVIPAIVQTELVPFPGPMVPILLDTKMRQQAVLHAKSNAGFFLLINRIRKGDESEHPRELLDIEGIGHGSELARVAADFVAEEAVHPSDAMELKIVGGGEEDDDAFEEVGDEEKELEDDDEYPIEELSELSRVGILARVLKVFRLPDGRMSALVHLLRRAQPLELVRIQPFPVFRVTYPTEIVSDEASYEATYRQVKLTLQSFFDAHSGIPEEVKITALSIESPGILADFVAQHLSRDFRERRGFLEELDLANRMRLALEVSIRELDMLTVGNRISQEIREKVEKHQREFLLREQLKAIRVELGEEKDPTALAVEELREKLEAAGLPEHASHRAAEEMKRLQLIPAESPEHNLIRSYLEWIASLPWSKVSEELIDISRAREVLDEDHYGLKDIKERILEYLAVRKLNPQNRGTLLCFAGPPGVGKTSLGQSIARALGREFYRFSVGGMRDEAEIKGHRRTYIGAMPGRLIQALKHVGTSNPVVMLDELDKMGSDWRGDPSSAMLEVLDPSQNENFLDHYIDLTFDLSQVMFIATANVKSQIPGPLLDRLEVIDLPGYIPEEKVEIAHRYLLKRQRKEHGLTNRQVSVGKRSMRQLIEQYTHEAGVRELDRQIGKLCRKRAVEVVGGTEFKAGIVPDSLSQYLGRPRAYDDRLKRKGSPGLVTGLAWTPAGGAVLFIEAARMPGKGVLKTTGKLGEVMTESTKIALSYVKNQAEELGLPLEFFQKSDIHVHFPAGAVPKDGPSAGITITTALLSLLTETPVAPRLAMTGEISLGGEVLPVGGIREKVVAARAEGINTVILPLANEVDVEEIPIEVSRKLTFVFVSNYQDVMEVAFPQGLHLPVRASEGSCETKTAQKKPSTRRVSKKVPTKKKVQTKRKAGSRRRAASSKT
ncbi:MAG: endopeptidase La [Myxococcota bacterium]|nr:endopeptidase La [Myxococcota bacterium]